MEYPVYKCIIEDSLESDLQVDFVALVDRPAIEKNFLAFKEGRLRFDIDQEQRIISGPAMLADTLIYRVDPQIGEYYTVFDKPTIISIVQKFFKKGYIQNFNIMHDPEQKVSGITIYESFITDADRGIKPMKGFEDAPDGSWFLTAKVDDDTVWEKVKSGEVKGFSVEGIFKQVQAKPIKLSEEVALEKIRAILESVG